MNYYKHSASDFDAAIRMRQLPMVYVIATPDFEYIKVGMTCDFKQRLRNIQSGCPLDLFLWCSIRTPKPSEVETSLHKKLEHCSVRGEWFSPSESDLNEILDFCTSTNRNAKEVRSALLQA